VGAAVDMQPSHTRWRAFSTGFGCEFVCGLCARIGADRLPESWAQHVEPVGTVSLYSDASASRPYR